MLLLGLGITSAFACSAGLNRVVMLLVPVPLRSFALALLVLIIHAFGDVPSPPILGVLIGAWAPNCGTVWLNGTAVLNPLCTSDVAPGEPWSHDQYGILYTLFCASAYMNTAWCYWGLCYVMLGRLSAQRDEDQLPGSFRSGRSEQGAGGALPEPVQ